MKHLLTEHHKRHLRKIGVADVPDSLHIPFGEYDEHHKAWKRTLPRASAEELHKRVLANVAWKRQNSLPSPPIAPAVTQVAPVHISVDHRKELRWLFWILAAIALLLLFSGRAHAQFSKINSITTKQGGSGVGFHASPFNINCGANLTCTDDGTTFNLVAGAGGSVAWDGISAPTAGGLTFTMFANGDTLWTVKRKTDTLPTGNFFDFQNAAGTSLCKLDITGLFSSCAFPYANLTGAPTQPVTIANASHKWLNSYTSGTGAFTQTQPDYADLTGTPTLAANTTATASNFFTAYNSTTGAFTKAQPAFSDISGTLALASAVFANQGTTTTVLHGNAAGNPSFAAVSISADVSGLGTGVATFLGTPSSANFFSAITDEIGNGSKAVKMDSVSGTGTALATTTGALTSTHCVNIDANSNFVDSGAVCGGGSGNQYTVKSETTGGMTATASTTYWLGKTIGSGTSNYADAATTTPVTGTVVALACDSITGGTSASATGATMKVCKGAAGATCSTGSMTMRFDSRNTQNTVSGLTLAVTAGDLLAFQFVTPAWATAPTSVYMQCVAAIQ